MEIYEAIEQTLGRGLAADGIWKIASLADKRTFQGGEVIVRQFDRNSDLIVVLEGSAQIRTFNEDLISEVGPGSIVGEVSLVDDQPRSATVRSIQHTKVAIIKAEELRKLIEQDGHVGTAVYRNIARTLCTRLRHATIHLDGLMTSKGPIPVRRG